MHRCLVRLAEWDEPELRLSSEEAHHLFHVMRLREGDCVVVCDGMGTEGEAVVTCAGPAGVTLQVKPDSVRRRTLNSRLWLLQALPKGKRMDLVVEKATELGVTDILPVLTERVIVRLDSEQTVRKVERWQRIAREAARQCRSPWVPHIHAVVSLATALDTMAEDTLAIVGALAVDARPLQRVVAGQGDALLGDVALFIGPEGDFTSSELGEICKKGAIPVSFGPRVLRTETAALFGLSVLTSYRDGLEDG